ncbi:hypothetical protein K435DRAFT_790966 [Dendrothele bispora CBS 962.96]|uniref:Uncharacterized protein n=1 Tax=Dendrothele bispora (strain CBS 962.96) TaxID=1314807 RepID=A0A4S8MPB3_DENBC|nr:hypothetical protein K435DRAFT_790966 [Dendrothele bispora CBS 962.96]
MPRGTTRSRSVGNATRGDVWGAFRGPSHGRGPFTSIYISTSPTLSRILLLNIAPPRRQDSSLKRIQCQEQAGDHGRGPVTRLCVFPSGPSLMIDLVLNFHSSFPSFQPFRDRLCQPRNYYGVLIRTLFLEQILFMLLDEIVELQSIQKAFRAHVNRWKCEIGDNVP